VRAGWTQFDSYDIGVPEPAIYVVVRDGACFHTGDNLGGYEVDQVLALGPDITTRYVEALVRAVAADTGGDAYDALMRYLERFDNDADRSAFIEELARLRAGINPDQLRPDAARTDPTQAAPDPVGFWDAYCSGGALIDFDRRRLMVFTYQLDPGPRLAFLDALTRTWPGWDVEWAFRWMFDLAAYPGVTPPVAPKNRSRDDLDELVTDLADLDDDDPRAVVTVAAGGTIRAYEVPAYEPVPWAVGPSLLGLLREDQRTAGPEQRPIMGLHLDVDRTRAGLWTTRWWYDIDEWWTRIWPGWSLQLWGDRADEQVARTDGALVLPRVDLAEEIERYGRRLDHLWSTRVREERSGPADPKSPADVVDLSRAEYLEARRQATTR